MSTDTNIVSEYANWKGRGSLKDLVAELQRQVDNKYDFVIDARVVSDELHVRNVDGRARSLRSVRSRGAERFIPRAG